MILRIRDRRTFRRLQRHGTRIRHSDLWCTWCPEPDLTTTSVAFAIARACGPAVQRNRLRRRLRSVIREIDRVDPLPPGILLIGTRTTAAELTFDQLRQQTTELLDRCRTVRSKAR